MHGQVKSASVPALMKAMVISYCKVFSVWIPSCLL